RQPGLLKFSTALVDEEEVGHGVIGDEQVHQPVVVHVGRHCAKRLAGKGGDSGSSADIREGAVAIVVKEVARSGLEKARHAIVEPASGFVSAQNILRLVILNEARNEQVELPVIVVVEPNRASGPTLHSYSSLLGHVGKRAVTVIMIQRITAVVGDIEVLPPVTVIVGCGHSHAKPSACDSCSIGHVSERAVVVVVVK